MRRPTAWVFAAAIGCTASASHLKLQDDVTIDSFTSFVARKGLTSTTVGTNGEAVLGWVEYLSGSSNVYVARQSANFAPQAVTSYAGDIGFDITDLSLVVDTADSNKLFAVYTLFPSTIDQPQNPAHNTVPPTASVVRVEIDPATKSTSATPEVLATGTSVAAATYSGKSGGVGALYTRYNIDLFDTISAGTSVFRTSSATSSEADETPLFRVRQGQLDSFTFRPGTNEATLAFANDRGDHAFIGIYQEGSSALTWVGPSFDMDSQPVWSPDGTKLGFLRFQQPLADDKGRSPGNTQEGGAPFVVMVATVSNSSTDGQFTVESSLVYDGCTSGYLDPDMYGVHPLQWSDNDHLLVSCENSGFIHLLSVDARKYQSEAVDLTPDLCDNQDWNVDDAGKWLYVAHNCDNNDTIAIARVATDGSGTREKIVDGTVNLHEPAGMSGDGFGIVPFVSGADGDQKEFVAFLQQTYNSSAAVKVAALSNKASSGRSTFDVSTVSLPHTEYSTAFDPSLFVQPVLDRIPKALIPDQAFDISVQITLPPGVKPTDTANLPAIMFTHGGAERQMYGGFHFSPCYGQLYAINQFYAASGYAVISVNYRKGVGYGKSFRDCKGCGWTAASEYQDVLAAAQWFGQQPYVDKSKIAIYGLSYGGLNALQALSRNSDVFAAGAAVAPVFNWITQTRFDGGTLFDYTSFQHVHDQSQPIKLELRVGPEPDLAAPTWKTIVDNNIQAAWDASPSGHIDSFSSPVLVIQGDADEEVDIQESIGLIRMLRKRGGVHVESMMFPDEQHGLTLYQSRVKAYTAVLDFFNRRMNVTKRS